MSLFFGGGGAKVKPQFTGLAAQTSTSNLPITLAWGQNRIAPNIIWQGDFKAHKKKQKAGKGGGGSQTYYTYSASFQLGLCWGEINDVIRVWKDQSKETSYAALGFTLFKGTNPQAPWGYLTTNHPSEALGYSRIAHLDVPNYDLGQTNQLGQHSFEVKALLWNTQVNGSGDADPALIIQDLLTNNIYGVVINSSILNTTSLLSGPNATTTGDGAFQTYCRAMGFGLSPALSNQEPANTVLNRWTKLCNTALVWTGYDLKFIPYSSETITANGVTYLPDITVRYSLDDTDYIFPEGQDPIKLERVDPADAYNWVTLSIRNRDNEYNELPAEWRDSGLIDQFGERPMDNLAAQEVCEPDMGNKMAALIGQRAAYIRNHYEFRLGPQYCLIEPMDILQLYDPRWGTFYGRVKDISEDEEDKLTIVCEEYHGIIGKLGTTTSTSITNTPINTATPAGPVNTPLIFEPPLSLSGASQVWVAASGGDNTTYDPNWGGCYVWLSTDNVTYNQIGEIDTPARQGKLTANLAAYGGANPDVTNILRVSLLMSNGELADAASASDAEAGVTVSYVGGEYLSYQDVTLTGTAAYDIDTLWRGQYGSTAGSHSTGDNFARLDEAIFKYDLPPEYIGVTLYLKFQSYNIFGGGVQDLSACTAYTYTPTGSAFGGGTGGVPTTPTGLSGTAGTTFSRLTWNANPANDGVTGYQVWRATGASQPFGSATIIASVSSVATEYVDSAVSGGQAYTYFLVAVNSIGSSTNTSGVNLTPVSASAPYGFAFGPKSPVASKILAAFDTPLAWTMPSGLADCQGTIVDSDTATATAPTAQTDFDIQSPPGTSVGTMRFAIGSLTATFIKASNSSIPLGQIVQIVCPSNLNGISGAITGAVKGTR